MAFAGIAAIASGAEITATIALSAVAEVGTALTVVGAVTGNKDLMKVGAVMGLVGGIGGLAMGAGSAAVDTAAAQSALDEGAQIGAANSLTEASDWASLAQQAPQELTQAVSEAPISAAPEIGAATPPGAPSAASPGVQPQGIINQATAPVSPPPAPSVGAQAPQGANAPMGAQGPSTPFDSGVSNPYSNPTDARLAAGTQGSPMAPLTSGSLFSQFLTFAKGNKELLNAGATLLGGAMKGAADYQTNQQNLAFKRDQFNRANSVGTFAPTVNTGIIGGAMA